MAFNPKHLLNPTFMAGIIENRPDASRDRQGYIGMRLCPWFETPERQLTWDVVFQENTMAGIYDARGEAIPGDEILYSTVVAKLADIKASRMLEAWTTQHFVGPGEAAFYSDPRGRSVQAKLTQEYNKKLKKVDDEIDTLVEFLVMRSLQGSISWGPKDADGNAISPSMPQWNAENMSMTLTYPLASNLIQDASALVGYDSEAGAQVKWTTVATANPLKDIQVIDRLIKKQTGSNLRDGVILLSSTMMHKLVQNTEILKWITGVNKEQEGARRYADPLEVQDYIRTRTGYSIEVYDAFWTYRTNVPGTKPTITQVPFLDEYTVLFLPRKERMGMTLTTQLKGGPASNAPWIYGKVPWTYNNPKPPYDIELGINATAMPQYEYYDWFVLKAND